MRQGVIVVVIALGLSTAAPAAARVLRVGAYHGVKGQYDTIQSAVDAAKKGDWILIPPGDYHERGDRTHKPKGDVPPSGVLIRTPNLHIRGMDRNKVVVDGTKPGSPECSSKKGDQDFGAKKGGKAQGRNGRVAYKADNVNIQNLTACNFLTGAGSSGNEVWWNGGDGSGQIGLGPFGHNLNATTTFSQRHRHRRRIRHLLEQLQRARRPGTRLRLELRRFQLLHRRLPAGLQPDDGSTTGRSSAPSESPGTNSGGQLVVKNSEFDHNKDGFDTNSQNNDDSPSPQDGCCAGGGDEPDHGHGLVLGLHEEQRPRQQQSGRPRAGSRQPRPGRDRDVDRRARALRHHHEQHVYSQRVVGGSARPPTPTTRRPRRVSTARAAIRTSCSPSASTARTTTGATTAGTTSSPTTASMETRPTATSAS